MKKWTKLLSLCLISGAIGVSATALAGCGKHTHVFDDEFDTTCNECGYVREIENATAVTGVKLNMTTLNLVKDTTGKLTATIAPADATNQKVTWESSDESVATVDSDGTVTAIKVGSATITVTTENGNKTATCKVNITATAVFVTGVTLDKAELDLKVGGSGQLTAAVAPDDATNQKVTWSSSDESVATVDSDGKVTAVAKGTATVTVTTVDGNISKTCAVTVTEESTTPPESTVSVTGVTLDKTELSIKVGGSGQLTATVAPDDATNQKVTWESSDESVATVDSDGKVTAIAKGTATVTVTTVDGNISKTCAVTVTEDTTNPPESTVSVTGVTLDKAELSIKVGGSGQLTAAVTPAGATNQKVTWESSDESVATVDSTGKVTAVAKGVATVTVTTVDGNISKTCAVTVTEETTTPPASSITVSSVTVTSAGNAKVLTAGETLALSATVAVTPDEAANKGVTWEITSGSAFATISAEGVVTGVAEGAVKVKATSKTDTTKFGEITLTVKAKEVTPPAEQPVSGSTEFGGETQEAIAANGEIYKLVSGGKTLALAKSTGSRTWSKPAVEPNNFIQPNGKGDILSLELAEGYTYSVKLSLGTGSDSKTLKFKFTTVTGSEKSVTGTNAQECSWELKAGTYTLNCSSQSTPRLYAISITATPAEAQKIPVESVTLNKTATVIDLDSNETLTATVAPADATNKTVSWSSSNDGVATVDGNGKVTAVATGTATITATAADGKSATCAVTVRDPSVPLKKYDVTFISEGKSVDTQQIEEGSTVSAPSNLTKEGYKIKGWYLEESGTTAYDFSQPVVKTLTLYAIWVEKGSDEPIIPSSDTIKVLAAQGDQESAYIEWQGLNGASWYNVYYKLSGGAFVKLDGELVRQYPDRYRADAVGLKAGTYSLKIVPWGAGGAENEAASLTVDNVIVIAHERTGYAFVGGNVPGAYNADGTLKTGAQVVYVTAETAKTVTATVNGVQVTGFQSILDERKDSSEPICFRIIGMVSRADLDHISSSAEGLQVKGKGTAKDNKATSYITIEGVGNDATINDFGILIRNCKNVELRNFGVINFMDDGVSIDTGNSNLWVHNLDLFYGSVGGDKDQAKGDGSLDSKGSDYCTYSYNHFWDSGKCNLLGNGDSESSGEGGATHLTYHHNWYDHSDSRHPRIRVATVHVYNNYFDGNSKYGVGATMGSSAFVENNYFRSTAQMKPMLISMQGSDMLDGKGTFSSEDGGMIKSFGNKFDCTVANLKYVTHKQNATEFDCYEAATRDEQVPSSCKTKKGNNTYNNFDTASGFYKYTVQSPDDARDTVIKYAGRVDGGDLKWTFDNSVEDANYAVIQGLKSMVVNYKSKLLKVGK